MEGSPEGSPTYAAVLIYDGECPFCSAASTAIRRLDDVGAISWYHDAAQGFLTAQFDDPPFALVLVDPATGLLYIGRDAARELADRAGMPELVSDLIERSYENLANTVQRTVGSDRADEGDHGILPIGDAAREAFPRLSAGANAKPTLESG